MSLDSSTIKANALLATLTDEQVGALVTLSTNDEQTVIGAKIGALHGQYDTDILTVTGIAKNQGEKSYDYTKRVLTDYKTKLAGFATAEADLAKLKTEKADLETKLAAGAGDALIKQQLTDATTKLQQLQGAYDADKVAFEDEKVKLTSALHTTKVENHFDNAIAGLKFKATIPDSVKSVLLKNVKQELLSTTKPEFTATGDLIFRDANGAIMSNPSNKLNPFTAAELISKALVDVIDLGRQQPGGGSGPVKPGEVTIIDISAAKTQIEADEIIQKHLLAGGMLRTDQNFGAEQNKLRKEHGVEKLPIR